MDLLYNWFDLRPGVSDVELCDAVERYLGALVEQGAIRGFRILRRKLGLAPPSLGEFLVTIEVDDLAQLDRAFEAVSSRAGVVEGLHAAVNQQVTRFSAGLYRDFPDPHRRRGEEQF